MQRAMESYACTALQLAAIYVLPGGKPVQKHVVHVLLDPQGPSFSSTLSTR